MMNGLSAEQEAVIGKVEKLLALSRNNSNEAEAQSAAAKAMELLAAYNLDMAIVGQNKPVDGKRADKKRTGGLYSWQRDLWHAVAELNFCRYWFIRGLERGSKYEHRILGRQENVISTELMAEYLQDTVERLTVEYGKINFPGKSRFIRELIAYREGMATRLYWRLQEIRQQRIAEERRKQEEMRTRGSHGGSALVLADVINTEEDFNNDYINGWEPGTSARNRAEREARRAAAKAAADEQLAKEQLEWEAFAAANPAEAERILRERARAEEQRKAEDDARWAKMSNRPVRERKLTSREVRMQSREFQAGYVKGADVGLDKQVSKSNTKRIG